MTSQMFKSFIHMLSMQVNSDIIFNVFVSATPTKKMRGSLPGTCSHQFYTMGKLPFQEDRMMDFG